MQAISREVTQPMLRHMPEYRPLNTKNMIRATNPFCCHGNALCKCHAARPNLLHQPFKPMTVQHRGASCKNETKNNGTPAQGCNGRTVCQDSCLVNLDMRSSALNWSGCEAELIRPTAEKMPVTGPSCPSSVEGDVQGLPRAS